MLLVVFIISTEKLLKRFKQSRLDNIAGYKLSLYSKQHKAGIFF